MPPTLKNNNANVQRLYRNDSENLISIRVDYRSYTQKKHCTTLSWSKNRELILCAPPLPQIHFRVTSERSYTNPMGATVQFNASEIHRSREKENPPTAPRNIMVDTIKQSNETSPNPKSDQTGNVPSGFVLKLFQMVNGAPDEVISVSV